MITTRFNVIIPAVLSFTTLAFLVFFFFSPSSTHLDSWSSYASSRPRPSQSGPDLTAGNSTLGFQAILALSQGTKWRVSGIEAAAAVSGIEIDIPPQPGWSEPFVNAFQEFGPVAAHGAAMAWLAHIDLLKYVIARGYGSALIMEDDSDWDVDIRNQTVLIANAVRALTHQPDATHAPYGLDWDVLWMGHCSDPPNAEEPMVVFDDPTVAPHENYQGLNRYITEVLDEGQRAVHYSWNPVCTFAYAVTAKGARKLLARASLGRGGAFDLMLMGGCQQKEVDCITVNPEVFDAYHPAGGDSSEVRAGDLGVVADAKAGLVMGHTDNIMRSARCAGKWHSTCLSDFTAPSR